VTSFLLNFILPVVIFFLPFFITSEVNAYQKDQFDECILAAKSNSAVADVPSASIEAFCDCALTAIVDEGKNEKNAAVNCAKRTLNN